MKIKTVWRCYYINCQRDSYTSRYVATEEEAKRWKADNPDMHGHYDRFDDVSYHITPVEVLQCEDTGRILIVNAILDLEQYEVS